MLAVGTSGFSYKDWLGPFYPKELSPKDMLIYYARFFNVVELDFTYYQMPGIRTIKGLNDKVPDNFKFCVKAHKTITHDMTQDKGVYDSFSSALEPMSTSGKLACILAQFPWSFKLVRDNVNHLLRLRDAFPNHELVIEFRNSEWIVPETFKFLKKYKMGFCCVDEPSLKGLMPPSVEATSRIGYVRFHGRNSEKWWKHDDPAERYDYLYSHNELEEWLPKVAQLGKDTDETYVLFNNHRTGQAAQNAQLMIELFEELKPLSV